MSGEWQPRRPVKGREQAFGLSIKEELDDFRTRAPGERVLKLLESRPNNLSARRFRVAGLTKQFDVGINPFGICRVEADGPNPMPRG